MSMKWILTAVLLFALSGFALEAQGLDEGEKRGPNDGLGWMALPMIGFTGAGFYDWKTSTGAVYGYGSDGGRFMQSFGYDIIPFPYRLFGARVQPQVFWSVPFNWYQYDLDAQFDKEDYPSLGVQVGWVVSDYLFGGGPGSDPDIGLPGLTNPPWFPSTFSVFIGASYSMAREQVEGNVGISIVRYIW